MALHSFLFVLSLAALGWSFPQVCETIADAISDSSDVYYPGLLGTILGINHYESDIHHWASSSSQWSLCSVQPGSAEDVGIILGILASNRTAFAVKGGGHASNPGFSSTKGVHIAMSRFSEVTYDAASQTVVVGAGLIWDDVYSALEPYNVNVVGGRVTGVGVAGFTLGGGYSWLTNQRGLTIDTVIAFELVKPDGNIVNVTQNSDPDLFFALKGGLNNFGIVTKFTLQTFPQGMVWGGLITYTFGQLDEVNAAAARFSSQVTDPKAGIITTYNFLLGQPGVSQILFYDAPTPPDGIFDDFLAIPHFTKDIDTRSFLSLVLASPANTTQGTRGVFHTVPLLAYTPTLIDAILNETKFWGSQLSWASGLFISYDVEPFLPTLFSFNTEATAYPPSRSVPLLPLNLYYAWAAKAADDAFHDAIRKSAEQIYNVALSEGQQDIVGAALYPNYAIFDTPVERIYGSNLDLMRKVKAAVDPDNVMGLAGGFKV
ncbi:FAD-binding domain-containing protein [Hymenopellis radicata]|nr:FAD-binding domain-containing protein [Hymenopellis radicata]